MILGLVVNTETIVIGALTGLTYAVLGAGLVLIYRATKVINFAHGEIGAFGAAILARLVLELHWNFFLALGVVAVIGGVLGFLIEATIIRRLFSAPRLVLLVATIGVAQLLFVAQLVLPEVVNVGRFPTPIDRSVRIGGILLRGDHFMVIGFVPAVMVMLALFLGRTPYGIALRASADNPDAARMAGISIRRVSTVVWVTAAVLSTATFVLIAPMRGTLVGQASIALGPSLLLRALAAALFGRLVSLPLTLVGGVVIGIVEALMFVNVAGVGPVDALLFVAVLVLVLLQSRGATDEQEAWSMGGKARPIPERIRAASWFPLIPRVTVGVALGAAVLLPLVFTTASRHFLFARVVLYALVGVSVVVITGWAGQLSLAQFALVGVGSVCLLGLHSRGVPFAIAVVYATGCGVLVAVAIGAPALRIKGLFLAVTTLAFAVAGRSYFLGHGLFYGDTTIGLVPRGKWGFIDLADSRTYYYVSLAVLVGAIVVVTRLRRTGIGRAIIAVRENERAAAASTVSPAVAKLTAFGVSGGLAALAGALLAGLRVQFGAGDFGVEESLRIVAMTIIGGIGSVAGALLGAVYVLGLPALMGNSATIALLTSGAGLLLLLMYLPGGLLELVQRGRDSLFAIIERRMAASGGAAAPSAVAVAPATAAPVDVGAAAPAVVTNGSRAPRAGARQPVPGAAPLRVRDVTVRFGGLQAVRGVDVDVAEGEFVGIIGSNGAGKSTLLDAIGGFTPTAGGVIEVHGHDVTGTPAHERARLGVARVFQNARLFGDLTVRETVAVSLEAHERSELVPSMLALPPSRRAEARKQREAAELIDLFGLGRYGDTLCSDLSTGTRRVVELAAVMAAGARLILLDEPTAGLAQRETEAFGPIIKRVQAALGATVVMIEHDMPLMMSLSDRVYCMAAGAVIAEGVPHVVRDDPKVIAAYLGTDERAIRRSGAASAPGPMPPASAPWAPPTGPDLDVFAGNGYGPLDSLTRRELIELAGQLGHTGVSRYRKAELVALVQDAEEVEGESRSGRYPRSVPAQPVRRRG